MTVKNAADEAQVNEAAAKEKRGRLRDMEDLRFILATVQGRRFVWRQLTECGVFKSSFTGNSTTFFNEGRREVGLKLMADVMDAKPEAYLQMATEAKREESNA